MSNFWHKRRVLVTGHTGFKGAWLCLLLNRLGANISGYSLPPPTTPSLFDLADVCSLVNSRIGDVRDLADTQSCVRTVQPEIIFHFAAQSIVRESYAIPAETFEINMMGTVNVLEAIRLSDSAKAVVIVTSDKCYEIPESPKRPFREHDRLGGHDPYSASKACAELAVNSFRRSFFSSTSAPAIATARAGNVIGGGDYGQDRLLPDFFRAAESSQEFVVRNPDAIRPWQHVLDALSGYLALAESLAEQGKEFAEAWNFGPVTSSSVAVRQVIQTLISEWSAPVNCRLEGTVCPRRLHESVALTIDSTKATEKLNWSPVWSVEKAIREAAAWHASRMAGQRAFELCNSQIAAYQEDQRGRLV